MKVLKITLELRGHDDPEPVVVAGQPLRLGHHTQGRYGLDAVVDERLVRYIALLALRRRGGALDGWTTADELGYLADRGGTGLGAAKFLQRRLLDYPARRAGVPLRDDGERAEGHLIQFEPRTTDHRKRQHGGLSRGPFRLGVSLDGLVFAEDAAWSWLLPSAAVSPALGDSHRTAPELLELAGAMFAAGDIIAARQLAAAGVHAATVQLHFGSGDRDDRFMVATLLDLVANLDMELGQPRSSLAAAVAAGRLFTTLRHPLGIAHTHQVRAHALGQLDDVYGAVAAARNALAVLDRARAARTGPGRAAYTGVLGQRLSKIGRHAQADRRLRFALATCEYAGLGAWSGVWALRLCENAVGVGRLHDAEGHLERAHGLLAAAPVTVPQVAALTRVTAQFLLASGRREEAVRWATEAYRLGIVKGMANQVRLMTPILAALGISNADLM